MSIPSRSARDKTELQPKKVMSDDTKTLPLGGHNDVGTEKMIRPSTWKSAKFDEFVNTLMPAWHVPGIAIAVIDGEEISVQNYGFADDPSVPITNSTLFDCASTSKSFTAAALAALVENDENYPQVKWDTVVADLIPEDFVMSDPAYTRMITIEDILSHRTGLPIHDDALMGLKAKKPDDPRSVTRNLRNLPLSCGLRTKEQYSNIMYTVASHLVEQLAKQPFRSFLREKFWKPLGMDNTYLEVTEAESENKEEHLAIGYRWDDKTKTLLKLPWWRQPEGIGAGSIFSCVSDWAKWVRAMIHKTPCLSESSYKALFTPRSITNPEREGASQENLKLFSHELYALGLEVVYYRGHRVIGHDGCVDGFESKMYLLPEHNWGIVIFGNGEGAGYLGNILKMTLIDDILNIPMENRVDWAAKIRANVDEERRDEAEESEKSAWGPTDEDSTPAPLELEEFAGSYHNAGYRTYKFSYEAEKNVLFADCSDRSNPLTISCAHVGGDRFDATVIDTLSQLTRRLKARFCFDQSGEDGETSRKRFGMEMIEEMPGYIVWFDEVAEPAV